MPGAQHAATLRSMRDRGMLPVDDSDRCGRYQLTDAEVAALIAVGNIRGMTGPQVELTAKQRRDVSAAVESLRRQQARYRDVPDVGSERG